MPDLLQTGFSVTMSILSHKSSLTSDSFPSLSDHLNTFVFSKSYNFGELHYFTIMTEGSSLWFLFTAASHGRGTHFDHLTTTVLHYEFSNNFVFLTAVSIAFSPVCLIDFLAANSSEENSSMFTTAHGAVFLRCEVGNNCFKVIMMYAFCIHFLMRTSTASTLLCSHWSPNTTALLGVIHFAVNNDLSHAGLVTALDMSHTESSLVTLHAKSLTCLHAHARLAAESEVHCLTHVLAILAVSSTFRSRTATALVEDFAFRDLALTYLHVPVSEDKEGLLEVAMFGTLLAVDTCRTVAVTFPSLNLDFAFTLIWISIFVDNSFDVKRSIAL